MLCTRWFEGSAQDIFSPNLPSLFSFPARTMSDRERKAFYLFPDDLLLACHEFLTLLVHENWVEQVSALVSIPGGNISLKFGLLFFSTQLPTSDKTRSFLCASNNSCQNVVPNQLYFSGQFGKLTSSSNSIVEFVPSFQICQCLLKEYKIMHLHSPEIYVQFQSWTSLNLYPFDRQSFYLLQFVRVTEGLKKPLNWQLCLK